MQEVRHGGRAIGPPPRRSARQSSQAVSCCPSSGLGLVQRVRRKLALHQRNKNMGLAVGPVSVYATACLAWRTRLGTFDAKTGTVRTPQLAAVPVFMNENGHGRLYDRCIAR